MRLTRAMAGWPGVGGPPGFLQGGCRGGKRRVGLDVLVFRVAPAPCAFHLFGLTRSDMDFLDIFEKYWPFMALGLWFAYKRWNSRRVVAMLPELKKNGAIFVDVRSAGEFASGNAPGTINIPLQELGSRLGEIPRSSPVVLCCASGTRSGMAKIRLKMKGYREVHNIGTWSKFLD